MPWVENKKSLDWKRSAWDQKRLKRSLNAPARSVLLLFNAGGMVTTAANKRKQKECSGGEEGVRKAAEGMITRHYLYFIALFLSPPPFFFLNAHSRFPLSFGVSVYWQLDPPRGGSLRMAPSREPSTATASSRKPSIERRKQRKAVVSKGLQRIPKGTNTKDIKKIISRSRAAAVFSIRFLSRFLSFSSSAAARQ